MPSLFNEQKKKKKKTYFHEMNPLQYVEKYFMQKIANSEKNSL